MMGEWVNADIRRRISELQELFILVDTHESLVYITIYFSSCILTVGFLFL